MNSGHHREIEIKLRVKDVAAVRRRLRALGAQRITRVFERDVVFDTHNHALARTGRLLRLRNCRSTNKGPWKYWATWKGPMLPSARHKIRQEINVTISDGALFSKILQGIGYNRSFVYEKWRTSFRLPGLSRLLVELDHTPIGWFLELEGPGSQIDRAAHLLGESEESYIRKSYRQLYVDWCRSHGLPRGDMVFARKK